MRRLIAPILAVILIAGVGFLIFRSVQEKQVITVTGLIGSEKQAFFDDPRVQQALRRHGLEVHYEKVGSRRIATEGGAKGLVSNYDFGFPAGVPAATRIDNEYNVKKKYDVFFTPMTIASWKPVVDVLEANGIVANRGDYYGIIDMNKLVGYMVQGTRWNELPNNQGYNVNKSILVTSTNVFSSNSAAMYLSLASYVANGDNIVVNNQQANTVMPQIADIFFKQGFVPGSSAQPFRNYLSRGMGNSPLVMIYESQFLYQASLRDGSIIDDMILLYPEPTIFTQHRLLAMTDAGVRLGEALTTDEELLRLAIEQGYRNDDVAYFRKFIEQNKLEIPAQLINVINPPTYEVIEAMIGWLELNSRN